MIENRTAADVLGIVKEFLFGNREEIRGIVSDLYRDAYDEEAAAKIDDYLKPRKYRYIIVTLDDFSQTFDDLGNRLDENEHFLEDENAIREVIKAGFGYEEFFTATSKEEAELVGKGILLEWIAEKGGIDFDDEYFNSYLIEVKEQVLFLDPQFNG